eukprot:1157601-Pelagomonas_calceolata.AAC.4
MFWYFFFPRPCCTGEQQLLGLAPCPEQCPATTFSCARAAQENNNCLVQSLALWTHNKRVACVISVRDKGAQVGMNGVATCANTDAVKSTRLKQLLCRMLDSTYGRSSAQEAGILAYAVTVMHPESSNWDLVGTGCWSDAQWDVSNRVGGINRYTVGSFSAQRDESMQRGHRTLLN